MNMTSAELKEKWEKKFAKTKLADTLKEIGLDCFEPQGAFYAFPSVKSTGMNADEFANALLQEQKVAVVPGNAFGTFGQNNVRISYATSMNALSEAFDRMSAFVSKCK